MASKTPNISVKADGKEFDLDLDGNVEAQIADALGEDVDEDTELEVIDFGDLDTEAMESFPFTVKNTIALGELFDDHHDAKQVQAAWVIAKDRMSNPDVDDAKEMLNYIVHHGTVRDDETDFAQSLLDEGIIGKEMIERYFDYESFGRDAMMDARTSKLKDGRIIVWHKG